MSIYVSLYIGLRKLVVLPAATWVLCSAPLCKVVCSLCTAFWGAWSCYNSSLPVHGCAMDIRDAVTLFFLLQFVVRLWLALWAPGALPVCMGE